MDKPNFESVQTDILNGWRFSKVVQGGLPFSRAPKCLIYLRAMAIYQWCGMSFSSNHLLKLCLKQASNLDILKITQGEKTQNSGKKLNNLKKNSRFR